jgi:hypothetical protein
MRRKSKLLRAFNTFNILPIWTFFAPKPGVTDMHLVFRDKNENGSFSDWTEVQVFERRKPYHFIWNPLKRNNKLVVDALSQLKNLKNIQDSEKKEDEDFFQMKLLLSKGYLIILSIVVNYPHKLPDSQSRQFIVAETSFLNGARHFVPILSSPFHEL